MSEASILEALRRMEGEGYSGGFAARALGRIECLSCRALSPADAFRIEREARVDVETDPSDQTLVLGLSCPRCARRGTLLSSYGPVMQAEEAEVLSHLRPAAAAAA